MNQMPKGIARRRRQRREGEGCGGRRKGFGGRADGEGGGEGG